MNTESLREWLPAAFFENSFLELQLWQWIGLASAVLLAPLVAWLAVAILSRVVKGVTARTATRVDDRLVDRTAQPARMLLGVALFAAACATLALPVRARDFVARLAVALAIVAVTWIIVRVIDVLSAQIEERLEQVGRTRALSLVPLGRKTAKAVVGTVAFLVLLQNVGVNVTGLVAGLGIGGLAFALAAQKTIANFFGGIQLIADRPILVGDFCRFGTDRVGTVEEIGLRSTRVRTLDRTLVTIPNADFSEMQLENFAARDRMRLITVIGLRYETTPDQLRHVLAGIRALLVAHPMVTETPARVRFVGFGQHSLDLEIFAYVATDDWNDFLRIREDILLRMMDVVRKSGTGFAFPSQTLYLGRDHGLDQARREAAEREVETWRERNELPFPEFSEERIAELEGTVRYPPVGSATGSGEPSP